MDQKINANKRIDALKAEAEAIRAELAALTGSNAGQQAFAYARA